MVEDERIRREAAAWLARRQSGSADDESVFQHWVQADPRHARVFADVEDSWRRSAVLSNSAMARTSTNSRRKRIWTPDVKSLAGGGAVLACALGAMFWAHTKLSSLTAFNTPMGMIRRVQLADGSLVVLDTASAIRVAFAPSSRHVELLRGRARFVVRHDAQRPFTVIAGPMRVVDQGTIFDIGYRGRAVDVTLLKGALDVGALDLSHRRVVALRPGQRATMGAEISTPAVRDAPPAEQAWPSGVLAYVDRPLAEVVADTNRYSETKIRLGDPDLDGLRVTGSFKTGGPARLARQLATLFGLRVVAAADGALVLMPAITTDRRINGG